MSIYLSVCWLVYLCIYVSAACLNTHTPSAYVLRKYMHKALPSECHKTPHYRQPQATKLIFNEAYMGEIYTRL